MVYRIFRSGGLELELRKFSRKRDSGERLLSKTWHSLSPQTHLSLKTLSKERPTNDSRIALLT